MSLVTSLLTLLVSSVLCQHFIEPEWEADHGAVRTARYNRNTQDPGRPCTPSPCGENTHCMVNNQGHAICSCSPGHIPQPSPVDGCCLPYIYPTSPVIIHPSVRERSGTGPSPPSDPCSPTPCGPGTTCTTNRNQNPVCRCQAGYVPNPDTITGCRPECTTDPDCRMGLICESFRCVGRPDPCQPNPCGPGAQCSVNNARNALCDCLQGLVPRPDTITGCGPECVRDSECQAGFICQSQSCIARPDPCQPSPCGPGAECTLTQSSNVICRCKKGLIPKPDTITGCGPECTRDSDCQNNFVCQSQRCERKPDPCQPSPCGPGAVCTSSFAGYPICRCPPGLFPKPDPTTGCGPECLRDIECRQRGDFVCQSQRCRVRPDPCKPSPCGPNTFCINSRGNPICRCKTGFVPAPDTITGCDRDCVQDSDCQRGKVCRNYQCQVKPDPCSPSPCGPNTQCTPDSRGNPICHCITGYIPRPDSITGCRQECQQDQDCGQGKVCNNYRCVDRPDPCQPSPCGPNTKCILTSSGYPTCHCLPTYIPKPDTITGCGRECETDPQCRGGYICQNYQCVPRPDPCQPTPCGPNTQCNVNIYGNPVCTCTSGFSPSPDTITGCARLESRTLPPDPCLPSPCGPNTQCRINRQGNPVCECLPNHVPMPDTITGCQYRPDPCTPSPCGHLAECVVLRGTTATCRCPRGHRGDPFISCTRNECMLDTECPDFLACSEYQCLDPCLKDPCGQGANCQCRAHRPICSCPSGLRGNPLVFCEKARVVGGRYSPEIKPKTRKVLVIGKGGRDREVQGRTAGRPYNVAVVGHSYQPVEPRREPVHVVGSRYSGNEGPSLCSQVPPCSNGAVVVDARVGRRGRSHMGTWLNYLEGIRVSNRS